MPQDNIISFSKAKKAKKRTEQEKTAAENRVRFGRTKAEKQRDKLNAEKKEKHISGHKRSDDDMPR